MKQYSERKDNDELSRMLEELDKDDVYRSHKAGYHERDDWDVDVEYGFTEIYVYIPIIWRNSPDLTKREILSLAFDKACGKSMPTYGPRAIAWLELTNIVIPREILVPYAKTDRRLVEALDMSDWAKAQYTGKPVSRCWNLETGEITSATRWGKGVESQLREKGQ